MGPDPCLCGHSFDDHDNFGPCRADCSCRKFRSDYHAGLTPDATRVTDQMRRWHEHRDFYHTHDGQKLTTHNPADGTPQPCPNGR
jgi:hypothetical protein